MSKAIVRLLNFKGIEHCFNFRAARWTFRKISAMKMLFLNKAEKNRHKRSLILKDSIILNDRLQGCTVNRLSDLPLAT